MINTILVEDDLYIQKHFVDRLAADGEFHLVGVFRDAFEAEKHCDATVKLVLMDVQTQHKHSGLAAAKRIKKAFPQIKIVVATSLVDPEVLQRAKMGAADSLWYKDHGTEELMSVVKRTLAGIGRKTANLVMGDVFHKPAVVTDTHCIRICGRLGLTKNKEPAKVEEDLRKILPPERSSDFCHRLVLFGREYCKARGERCSECPLLDICGSRK